MEVQQFHYDNKIVQKFLYATLIWGLVGMLVGLILAFMFIFPQSNRRDLLAELWKVKTSTYQCSDLRFCG